MNTSEKEFLEYVEEYADSTWNHQEFLLWLTSSEEGEQLVEELGDKVGNYVISYSAKLK